MLIKRDKTVQTGGHKYNLERMKGRGGEVNKMTNKKLHYQTWQGNEAGRSKENVSEQISASPNNTGWDSAVTAAIVSMSEHLLPNLIRLCGPY